MVILVPGEGVLVDVNDDGRFACGLGSVVG